MTTAPEPPSFDRPYASRPTAQMTVGCVVIPVIVLLVVAAAFVYLRSQASSQLTVPAGEVVLVRALPEDAAPLLARFGADRRLTITGRTKDWRWLELRLWDDRRGWIRRPLDVLVWQIKASPTTPQPRAESPPVIPAVKEEMIGIPATSFTMGSPPGRGNSDEQPAHVVQLSAFQIDRTEVTVRQYWQCVKAGICLPASSDASAAHTHYLNDPAFDNHPMINVSWGQATTYCRWRGKRLPTEAEWELAAGWDVERKAKLRWPWGNYPQPERVNVGPSALPDAAPVGHFPADTSPAGVRDMGGNVSEWVFDWYKIDYYRVADTTNPVGPTHRRGAGTGRVVRGGSFVDALSEARTSNRRHRAGSYGYPTVGFRCLMDGKRR